MASHKVHAFDTSTGAFQSADLYVCRILVPDAHKVKAAWAYFQNIVTSGVVTATLRRVSRGGPRAGALVGTPLDNTQLNASANTAAAHTRRDFVLGDLDMAAAAPDSVYLLVLASTLSADRLDEACLTLEWEKA